MQIWQRTGTTFVFITHDIEEAVFLGQRVAVMSNRPGGSRSRDIDLDRSAADEVDIRSTPEFAAYRHLIWTPLRQLPARSHRRRSSALPSVLEVRTEAAAQPRQEAAAEGPPRIPPPRPGGPFRPRPVRAAVLALIWEFAPRLGLVDRYFVPPLSEVIEAWWKVTESGEMFDHVRASLARSGLGFGLAVIDGDPARRRRSPGTRRSARPHSGARDLPQHRGAGAAAGLHPDPRHRRDLEDRDRPVTPASSRSCSARSAAWPTWTRSYCVPHGCSGSHRSRPSARSSFRRRCRRFSPASGSPGRPRSSCLSPPR